MTKSIPLERRKNFQVWGLPKDEYADNGHVPYEMYVRETRRIVGRHVFTENDGSLAAGYARAPIHPDSIAITDWYMDSHSCTTDSRPGFKYGRKVNPYRRIAAVPDTVSLAVAAGDRQPVSPCVSVCEPHRMGRSPPRTRFPCRPAKLPASPPRSRNSKVSRLLNWMQTCWSEHSSNTGNW